MKKVTEHLITKGWKTSILGILLFLFTGCLLWYEKSSIGESIPLFFISFILLGIKDDFLKKINSIKLILILFLAFTLSGCTTQKKCNRKFPPTIIVKDSIIEKTNTIIRDTTIFVKLPKDTVKLTETIYINNGMVNMKPKEVQNGIVSAMAKIINNKLSVLAWINETSYNNRIFKDRQRGGKWEN